MGGGAGAVWRGARHRFVFSVTEGAICRRTLSNGCNPAYEIRDCRFGQKWHLCVSAR
jgi:hypothetical protein